MLLSKEGFSVEKVKNGKQATVIPEKSRFHIPPIDTLENAAETVNEEPMCTFLNHNRPKKPEDLSFHWRKNPELRSNIKLF